MTVVEASGIAAGASGAELGRGPAAVRCRLRDLHLDTRGDLSRAGRRRGRLRPAGRAGRAPPRVARSRRSTPGGRRPGEGVARARAGVRRRRGAPPARTEPGAGGVRLPAADRLSRPAGPRDPCPGQPRPATWGTIPDRSRAGRAAQGRRPGQRGQAGGRHDHSGWCSPRCGRTGLARAARSGRSMAADPADLGRRRRGRPGRASGPRPRGGRDGRGAWRGGRGRLRGRGGRGRREEPDFSLVTAAGRSSLGSTFLEHEPDAAGWVPRLVARGRRFVPAIGAAPIGPVPVLCASGRPPTAGRFSARSRGCPARSSPPATGRGGSRPGPVRPGSSRRRSSAGRRSPPSSTRPGSERSAERCVPGAGFRCATIGHPCWETIDDRLRRRRTRGASSRRSAWSRTAEPLAFFDGPGGTQVPQRVIDAVVALLPDIERQRRRSVRHQPTQRGGRRRRTFGAGRPAQRA